MRDARAKKECKYLAKVYDGKTNELTDLMILDSEEYKRLKENQEKYAPTNNIQFLKEVFSPDNPQKSLTNVNLERLIACLEKYVISITYKGPHSVQFELNDEKTKHIITFYTSLNKAYLELMKLTNSFYQINTRYIVNYRFINRKKITKREIEVQEKCHRVNKKFENNIEIIKRLINS